VRTVQSDESLEVAFRDSTIVHKDGFSEEMEELKRAIDTLRKDQAEIAKRSHRFFLVR